MILLPEVGVVARGVNRLEPGGQPNCVAQQGFGLIDFTKLNQSIAEIVPI
jgi:hypothetical protein